MDSSRLILPGAISEESPLIRPLGAPLPKSIWPYVAWISALVLVLWSPRLRGPIDLRYDAGVYYLLGVSLAEGHGYRIASEPGAPEGVQYPPALPAFVALHAKLFRTTDPIALGRWLHRSYFVLFGAFALSVFALARKHLGAFWAAVATTLCLLQFNTYLLSNLLFTELPFALVSVLFFLTKGRSTDSPETWGGEVVSFLLSSLAFFLRTAGLALLATWVAEALLRRHWRVAAMRAGLALLPIALWQLHVSRVHRSEEYRKPAYAYQRAPYQFYNVTYAENLALTDPFRPEKGRVTPAVLVRRLVDNIAAIPSSIGEGVSTVFGFWRWGLNNLQDAILHGRPIAAWTMKIPLLVLGALVFVGLAVIARRGKIAFGLYVVTSIALVCSTPWPEQFSRYVAPLAPFLAIGVVVAGLWIRTLIRERLTKRWNVLCLLPLYVLAVCTASIQLFTLFQIYERWKADPPMSAMGTPLRHHVFYHDSTWKDWEGAVEWIGKNSKPEAIIATVSPHLLYLWTGRHAIFPPMESNAVEARRLLETVPVSYVIVDQLEFVDTARVYAEPAMMSPGSDWKVVYTIGKTRVYSRPN